MIPIPVSDVEQNMGSREPDYITQVRQLQREVKLILDAYRENENSFKLTNEEMAQAYREANQRLQTLYSENRRFGWQIVMAMKQSGLISAFYVGLPPDREGNIPNGSGFRPPDYWRTEYGK